MRTLEIGAWGEEKAARYLEKNHYEVVERNFKKKWGELDIVARQHNQYIVVEVKTRKGIAFGHASEAVNERKQAKIKKAAYSYLKSDEVDVRFDVIEVYYNMIQTVPVVREINHIQNAF